MTLSPPQGKFLLTSGLFQLDIGTGGRKSAPLAVPQADFTDPTVAFHLKTVHLDDSQKKKKGAYLIIIVDNSEINLLISS